MNVPNLGYESRIENGLVRKEMSRNVFNQLALVAALAGRILLRLEEHCGFNGKVSKPPRLRMPGVEVDEVSTTS
jgi:hypothetical protein